MTDGTRGKVVGFTQRRHWKGTERYAFCVCGLEVGIADGISGEYFLGNVLRTTVGKEVEKTEGSTLFFKLG